MRTEVSEQRESIRVVVTFDREEVHVSPGPFGLVIELEHGRVPQTLGAPAIPRRVIHVALPELGEAQGLDLKVLSTHVLAPPPVIIAPTQPPQIGPARASRRLSANELRPSTLQESGKRAAPLPPALRMARPDAKLYESVMRRRPPLARLLDVGRLARSGEAVVELNPIGYDAKGNLVLCERFELTIRHDGSRRDAAPRSLPPLRAPVLPPQPAASLVAREGLSAVSTAELLHRERLSRISPAELLHRERLPRSVRSRAQATRYLELARTRVINPEHLVDIQRFFPTLQMPAEYLVITDNQQWDAATMTPSGAAGGDLVAAFERLCAWKRARGLSARVVTISAILDGTYGDFDDGARDLQEVIRNFLQWAHEHWGVAWVLLGGDTTIIPAREVLGDLRGNISLTTSDPPGDNQCVWTGSYLKMKINAPGEWWPGPYDEHVLTRTSDGLLIPRDDTGASGPTQRGWYYTNDSWSTREANPTNYVRVNGPAAEVNANLRWNYHWNTIPTDLYYSSLVGPSYGQPGLHDWDATNNGRYGQHPQGVDVDGIVWDADVSLGRAPLRSGSQAEAFVDKVLAYEQFRDGTGAMSSLSWPRRLLIASTNWGGRYNVKAANANPPADNRYFHDPASSYTLIKLKEVCPVADWRLIANITADNSDLRELPFGVDAAAAGVGWYYATSGSDLSPSGFEFSYPVFGPGFSIHIETVFIPIATEWIIVYGASEELSPFRYIFDRRLADGSLRDQELLREQLHADFPGINLLQRLYEDVVDLTPDQLAAGPVEAISEARITQELNEGPHFVSLSGHGSNNGCCYLSKAVADGLSNGVHTFIAYADSCLTSQYDDEAVSERLLRNPGGGAVAYVGNSRFSWIGAGDDYQRTFFDRLQTTRHLGLLADSRFAELNATNTVDRWAILSLNLMGDPEMPVWTGPPLALQIAHASSVYNLSILTITVRQPGPLMAAPVAGAEVHLSRGGWSRHAVTDSDGQVKLSMLQAPTGTHDLVVTKLGYRPVFDTVHVKPLQWIIGKIVRVQHLDELRRDVLVEVALVDDGRKTLKIPRRGPNTAMLLRALKRAVQFGQPVSFRVEEGEGELATIESISMRPG
ncbi:MAG: hypothetical protein KC636_12915 [Myxococcales bacterium]|nr:hypothetical protein [Myxococcales bacterium]